MPASWSMGTITSSTITISSHVLDIDSMLSLKYVLELLVLPTSNFRSHVPDRGPSESRTVEQVGKI